jgi:hypothetical protein
MPQRIWHLGASWRREEREGGRGDEEQAGGVSASERRVGQREGGGQPCGEGGALGRRLAAAAEGGEAEAEDAEGAQGRVGGGDQADPAGGGLGAPGVLPGERQAGLQVRDLAVHPAGELGARRLLDRELGGRRVGDLVEGAGDETKRWSTRWPPILTTIRKV